MGFGFSRFSDKKTNLETLHPKADPARGTWCHFSRSAVVEEFEAAMLMLLMVPWGLKMLGVFHQTSGGFLKWGFYFRHHGLKNAKRFKNDLISDDLGPSTFLETSIGILL